MFCMLKICLLVSHHVRNKFLIAIQQMSHSGISVINVNLILLLCVNVTGTDIFTPVNIYIYIYVSLERQQTKQINIQLRSTETTELVT